MSDGKLFMCALLKTKSTIYSSGSCCLRISAAFYTKGNELIYRFAPACREFGLTINIKMT